MRIGFPEMEDKVGHEVRSDGRQDADAQIAVHAVCFIGHHFLDAPGLVQGHLCLPDDFFSYAGRGYVFPVTVENLDVKLFFQLLNHRAEGGLCHSAGIGCKDEMAVFVQCHDIFHLL